MSMKNTIRRWKRSNLERKKERKKERKTYNPEISVYNNIGAGNSELN